jgi:RHS repeat-associated protein
MLSGPSSRNSTQALFALVGGLLLALLGLWRRHRGPSRPVLLPRLAAWATCAAALSFLVLPSCGGGDHHSDRNPRNGAQEITQLPASAEFYLADWQNSPVVLADAKGQTVSRTTYHPYGSIRSTGGQKADPWSFVGNEKDEGTGLGDFHARPYRAELGIFLGPDPVPVFSVEKTLTEPARLEAYGYGGGDPINRVDRDGKFWPAILAGAAVVVGITFTAQYANAPTKENPTLHRESLPALGIQATAKAIQVYGGARLVVAVGSASLKAGIRALAKKAAPKVEQNVAQEGAKAAGGARDLRAEAVAARDKLAAEVAGQRHPPATVVGGYSESTGRVTAGTSRGRGLGCAEGVCDANLGHPGDTKFTTAVRPRTGETVPVCPNCESIYGRGTFPPNATFKSDQAPK